MPTQPNTVPLSSLRPSGTGLLACLPVLEMRSMYYERHLPHWQPEGAAIFLTWRLYGSLPRSAEATTDVRGSISAGKAFVRVDRQVDQAITGPRWLADERVARCVVEALDYGERQLDLYQLRAWVLMVNHVHILIYPKAKLSRITKAVKNFSARQANAILGRTGQPFWQEESYDHWIRDRDELTKVVRYIEENPVVAGLVETAADWRYSSVYVLVK